MLDKIKKHLPSIVIFIVAVLVIHMYFFLSNSYYSPHGSDAGKQFVFFRFFLHHLFSKGEFFWSWKYGLGGDIWGQFSYYYATSIFFWISLLFDVDKIRDVLAMNLGFSLVKTFLAMVFVYALLQYKNRSRTGSIIGGLLYGGTIFFSLYSLRVDYMAEAFLWLPLVTLGYEIFIKRHNPFYFVMAVFVLAVTNFYFAFITSVFINIYCVFTYFNYSFTGKSFAKHYFQMVFYYGIGFCMAMVSFLPSVYAYLHADRFYQENKIPILFDAEVYKASFYSLFFPAKFPVSEVINYTLSMPILVFLLLLLGFRIKNREARLHVGLAFFFLLLYFIPFTYSFFNGLSAIQPRWLYLFVFTLSLAVSFIYDESRNEKRMVTHQLIMVLGSFVVVGALLLKSKLTGKYVSIDDIWVSVIGICTASILFFQKKIPRKIVSVGLIGMMIAHIGIVNFHFFTYHLGDYSEQFKENEQYFTNSGYDQEKEKQIVRYLQKRDSTFYRMLWMNNLENNSPMLYEFNGFSTYQSLIPRNIHQFMKERYNILQQIDSPSLFKDLDQRQYLETALSNKYYIVPENIGFVPYGYEFMKNLNGFNVYENKNFLPIGYMFEFGLNKKDFKQLSPASKDQLMLSAAVVEDTKDANLKNFDIKNLHTQILHEGYDNLILHDIKRNGTTFTALGEKAFLNLKIDKPAEAGEILVEIKIKNLADKMFKINVNGKQTIKRAPSDIYAYPKETFVFKVNPYLIKEYIQIRLSEGRYDIQSLKVYFNSYKNYEKLVAERRAQSLQVDKYTESSIKGHIEVKQKGLLFLSIPYSEGWEAKVDGKNTHFQEVSHSFIGIPIKQGKHEIELTYRTPYFRLGAVISIASALFLLIFMMVRKKR